MLRGVNLDQQQRLLAVARGDSDPDLVLRGGVVADVYLRELRTADVAICGDRIAGVGQYSGPNELDVEGAVISPALIDGHIHVESTLLTPFELARTICARGTGTIVADPHEIGNVLGEAGVEWMLKESEGAPADLLYMAPSCVPASPLETSGAEIDADGVARLLEHERVLGLAEVMNYPGVVGGDAGLIAKIAATGRAPVDGHAPGLSGKLLAAYVAAGPRSEHEATTAAEAREKLQQGLWLMLREGTPARNLSALLEVIDADTATRCVFSADDLSPLDLLERGHIDNHLRICVAAGVDPLIALQIATANAAARFALLDRGVVAPGRVADIAVFEDLKQFKAGHVFHRGQLVAQGGECVAGPRPVSSPSNTVKISAKQLDFSVRSESGVVRTIGVIPEQIVTESLELKLEVVDGAVQADPDGDVLKLAVVERHTGAGGVATAFVKGLGLRSGAIASTVAHDHHNLIVAGASDADMQAAATALAACGGGFAVASGGEVRAVVELPVAGLMSTLTAPDVAAQLRAAIDVARELGATADDPFMTLSFLGLEVIPSLKLTDLGLVDVDAFELVSTVVA